VGPFVINLTSSTTPMALSHPSSPELQQFSFFVSRRLEDNRERFRLHMGYFSTLAEAEEWLNVIRDLYPGAWAGEAPGNKLRARAAAADLAKQLPLPPSVASRPAAPVPTRAAATFAPPPVPVATASAARAPVARSAMPAAPAELDIPTLQAAPPLALPPTAATSARPAAPSVSVSAQSSAPRSSAPAQRSAAVAPGRPVAQGAKRHPGNVLTDGSNVREVMASLDETGKARQTQHPPGLRAPAPGAAKPAASFSVTASARAASTQAAAPAARSAMAGGSASTPPQAAAPNMPLSSAQVASRRVAQDVAKGSRAAATAHPTAAAPAVERARVAAPPPRTPSAEESITDTQVLRMLEVRRSDEDTKSGDDTSFGISLLKPEDTQTRRALKEAVIDNAPVFFAVQLQWSVQPVELDKVPPLAIFSAYTLYTVEGSREGRRWYGLRLGFFSDAISAKQVAYYVRSEFASVAVVPVTPAEKSRASDEHAQAATDAFQSRHVERKSEEFKLFDDDKPMANESPVPQPAAAAAPRPADAPVRKNKPLGRVRAKEPRSPKTLEETLEILGAGDLEIDNGRGETLNDTGVRHLKVEVQKNTPFAKLLDRISERVRKS
jgi:hypothetical protein